MKAFPNMKKTQQNRMVRMITTNSLTIAVSILTCLSIADRLQADLVIEYLPSFVPAGGNGKIDVTIRSDSVGGDQVNAGSYFFEITPVSGTGVLQFLPSITSMDLLKQSQSEQGDPNYLFGNIDVSAANFSSERQDPFLAKLVQSDGTLSGNNVTITSIPRLLARLELTQLSAGATGEFKIKLIEDGLNTLFVRKNGSLATIASQSYTNAGSIISAVPEPSTVLLILPFLFLWIIRLLLVRNLWLIRHAKYAERHAAPVV